MDGVWGNICIFRRLLKKTPRTVDGGRAGKDSSQAVKFWIVCPDSDLCIIMIYNSTLAQPPPVLGQCS